MGFAIPCSTPHFLVGNFSLGINKNVNGQLKDIDIAKDKYDAKKGKAWNILLEAIQPESDIYVLITQYIPTSDTPAAMQTIINDFQSPRIEKLENEFNQVLFQLPNEFRHAPHITTTVKATHNNIKRVGKDLKAINPTRGLTKATMLTTMTNCLHGDIYTNCRHGDIRIAQHLKRLKTHAHIFSLTHSLTLSLTHQHSGVHDGPLVSSGEQILRTHARRPSHTCKASLSLLLLLLLLLLMLLMFRYRRCRR